MSPVSESISSIGTRRFDSLPAEAISSMYFSVIDERAFQSASCSLEIIRVATSLASIFFLSLIVETREYLLMSPIHSYDLSRSASSFPASLLPGFAESSLTFASRTVALCFAREPFSSASIASSTMSK